MKQTKLQITIDVEDKLRPSEDELTKAGFDTELEFWIDFIYSDPPMLLDGARFELVEYDL